LVSGEEHLLVIHDSVGSGDGFAALYATVGDSHLSGNGAPVMSSTYSM
jgi:hypothetical protein